MVTVVKEVPYCLTCLLASYYLRGEEGEGGALLPSDTIIIVRCKLV